MRLISILLCMTMGVYASCGGKKGEDNNSDGAGSSSGSDTGGDDGSGGEDSTDSTEVKVEDADIKASGTLNIDDSAVVVAKSIDGDVQVAEVDEDGNFELGMDKESGYTVSVATGSLAVQDVELALKLAATDEGEVLPLSSDESGLNSIPTQLVDSDKQVELDLGDISTDSTSASSSTLDEGSALETLSVTEEEAGYVGKNDDNMAATAYLDVNGNGVLDHLEGMLAVIKVDVQWRDDTRSGFSVDSMKNQFVDLDTLITPTYQDYGFVTFMVANKYKKDGGTITFPEMKICATETDGECNTTATSKTVTAGESGDVVPDGGDGTNATQYGYSMKTIVNGTANNFPAGTYSLALDGGETITFPNFQPRNINEDSVFTYPQIKFTESGGTFASLDFKWMTKEPGASSEFRATTLNELALLFKGAGSSSGYVSMQIAGTNEAAGCEIPVDKVEGTIQLSSCHLKSGSNPPFNWSDLQAVSVGTRDAYQFQSGYFLIGDGFQ